MNEATAQQIKMLLERQNVLLERIIERLPQPKAAGWSAGSRTERTPVYKDRHDHNI
jgi:hypothetical protein